MNPNIYATNNSGKLFSEYDFFFVLFKSARNTYNKLIGNQSNYDKKYVSSNLILYVSDYCLLNLFTKKNSKQNVGWE